VLQRRLCLEYAEAECRVSEQLAPSLEDLVAQLSDPQRPLAIRARQQLLARSGELAETFLLHTIAHARPEGRAFALHRLPDVAPSFPIEPVLAALQDPFAPARQAAAVVLGGIDQPRVVAALSTILAEDKSTFVRASAAQALGKLRINVASDGLLAALQDPEAEVRRAAAEALGSHLPEVAIQALVNILQTDPAAAVRAAAAAALRQPHAVEAQPALLSALSDSDSNVQTHAAWALVALGSGSVAPLIQILDDQDSHARGDAALALGHLADTRALGSLIRATRAADPNLRMRSVYALGQFHEPAAQEAALIALADGVSWVRNAAAVVLAEIGEATAVEPLIARLADPNRLVRISAAMALGQIGDSRASAPLARVLQAASADPAATEVALSAVTALGKVGDADAVPVLTRVELDDTRSVETDDEIASLAAAAGIARRAIEARRSR